MVEVCGTRRRIGAGDPSNPRRHRRRSEKWKPARRRRDRRRRVQLPPAAANASMIQRDRGEDRFLACGGSDSDTVAKPHIMPHVKLCRQTSTRATNEAIIMAKDSPASNVGAPH